MRHQSASWGRAGDTRSPGKQHLNPVLGGFAKETGQDAVLSVPFIGHAERPLPSSHGDKAGPANEEWGNGAVSPQLEFRYCPGALEACF